jgi:hypothetical protein
MARFLSGCAALHRPLGLPQPVQLRRHRPGAVLQVLQVAVAVERPAVDAARPAAPVAGLRGAGTGVARRRPASASAGLVEPRSGRDADLPGPARLPAGHQVSPPLAWLPGPDQPTRQAGTAQPEPHGARPPYSPVVGPAGQGLGPAGDPKARRPARARPRFPCPDIRSASGRPDACALTRQVWPVDQTVSPSPRSSRDVAGANRSPTAPEPRGPRRQPCTAVVVPGSHRPAVRHGSAPLAVAELGPGRPIPVTAMPPVVSASSGRHRA